MSDIRHRFMPYCLQRLADGRYIVLNRFYKPLGWPNTDWIDYAGHPSAVKMRITPETARRLSWKKAEDLNEIHLYNDGCVPTAGPQHMRAYLDRLAILMAIKIDETA